MTWISIVKEYLVITQRTEIDFSEFKKIKIISLYMIEDFTIHVYMLKIKNITVKHVYTF